MWLRKRLENRRFVNYVMDWPTRRIAFELTPGEGRWFILSESEEPVLAEVLPKDFGLDPSWPELSEVLENREVWREHPQISPALRRFVRAFPEERAQAMLGALERGASQRFFVYLTAGEAGAKAEALAWRLPEELRRGREEHAFDSVLEAADFFGRTALFPELAKLASAEDTARLKAQKKKLHRALKKLEEEELRMQALVAGVEDGQAIQAVLYQFDKNEKRPYLDVPCPDGTERRIKLDPRFSLRDNMNRLFKKSAKGKRGLQFAVERRKSLESALDAVEHGSILPDLKRAGIAQGHGRNDRGRLKGIQAAAFTSSDGFTLYRGKSAKGNHEILSLLASPFDLWFHAANGPGAHVILKRDYPDQHVPEQSIREAACLAALKSHYANADRAEVMCALAKYVRKSKGLALGQVAVDQLQEMLHIELDPSVEEKLMQDAAF